MNQVMISGRLGKDVTLNKTKEGKSVVFFQLAVSNGKDKDPDWIPCKAWDEKANFISQWLGKGCRMEIVGRLSFKPYEKDGKTLWNMEVHVITVEPIDWKKDVSQAQEQATDDDFNTGPLLDIASDDLPF